MRHSLSPYRDDARNISQLASLVFQHPSEGQRMKVNKRSWMMGILMLAAQAAAAAEFTVLSGGAIEPGLKAAISSAEALKRSVLDAHSLVYNRASTGIYVDSLFKK
jgi:hypothetical protein